VLSVIFVQYLERKQLAIFEERKRAAEFETKADTAVTLYQDELGRSEQERRAMARQMGRSASDLKQLGIFVRPVKTVREARKLVDSALALDRDIEVAQTQSFSLDCIMLDFKQALSRSIPSDNDLSDYFLIANAFSDYNFTEERRPTVEQVSRFLQQAQEIGSRHRALMERIVAYDFAARKDREGYVVVVESLLNYVNEWKQGDFSILYKSEESILIVRSEERVRLAIWDKWASNESLLRFLPFRTLQPELADRFYIGDLQKLPIESLDLRGCKTVVINQSTELPLLRRVYIQSGQLDKQKLRDSIITNEPFEIVEIAER
jgi:hypothetical protein